jgi:predicted ester cyclase
MDKQELERLDDQGISAWDGHDADAWADMLAEDVVIHDWTIAEPIRGREAARQYLLAWVGAFPDMQVKRTNRVVGDDAVAAEVEFTGTNSGAMVMGGMEIPATNRPVVGRGSYIAFARDGKVTEFRSHVDAAGMMMQLGLMPSM